MSHSTTYLFQRRIYCNSEQTKLTIRSKPMALHSLREKPFSSQAFSRSAVVPRTPRLRSGCGNLRTTMYNTKNIKMKSFRNKSDKLLREIKLIQFYIGCYANPNPKVEGTIEYRIPVLACTAVQQRNMRGLFLCSYAVEFFRQLFSLLEELLIKIQEIKRLHLRIFLFLTSHNLLCLRCCCRINVKRVQHIHNDPEASTLSALLVPLCTHYI